MFVTTGNYGRWGSGYCGQTPLPVCAPLQRVAAFSVPCVWGAQAASETQKPSPRFRSAPCHLSPREPPCLQSRRALALSVAQAPAVSAQAGVGQAAPSRSPRVRPPRSHPPPTAPVAASSAVTLGLLCLLSLSRHRFCLVGYLSGCVCIFCLSTYYVWLTVLVLSELSPVQIPSSSDPVCYPCVLWDMWLVP